MNNSKNIPEESNKLTKSGIRYIIAMFILLIIQAIILFAYASTIYLPRAWLFLSITFIYYLLSTIILYRVNPELINQRGDIQTDAKLWDQFLMRAHNIMLIFIMPAIIGLDVGRFHWSNLSIYYVIPGFIFYIISTILINWAMIVNPHFEATVRIQKDRDHKVITKGPYSIIRHPGYLSGILWSVAVPLITGSFFGLIPGGIAILLLILRTFLEDKTLQSELTGYSKYVKSVKYRLFPGVW